jgi:hypothetical protein
MQKSPRTLNIGTTFTGLTAGEVHIVSYAFIFNINPSSRSMGPGTTQPLTEMRTRNLPGGIGRAVRKADNLTAICEPIA